MEAMVRYYLSKTISGPFDEAVTKVIAALEKEGFGILTDIDVRATMKKKLDIDFQNYRILGACNPPLARAALEAEDKIGTLLPCNVIVQDRGGDAVEVAAIDPAASMERIGNPALTELANTVRAKLQRVIESV